MLITKLHKMRTLLDKHRPLNVAVMKNIQADLMLKYNQQSNAIEGNTLDIFETRVLLESGITANGKPFKDHLDIISHQDGDWLLNRSRKRKCTANRSDNKKFPLFVTTKNR